MKCDGTRAETRFRLSAQRTSPFKSAGGRQFSRILAAEVCASAVVMLDTPCSEVECKTDGYTLHSHVSRSLPLPYVTVCHQISAGLYVSYILLPSKWGPKVGRCDHSTAAGSKEKGVRLGQQTSYIFPTELHPRRRPALNTVITYTYSKTITSLPSLCSCDDDVKTKNRPTYYSSTSIHASELYSIKVKVKLVLEQDKKAQRGRLYLYSFFNLGARWVG